MKRLILLIILLSSILILNAQNLTVEGAAPDLYINHTVVPKDNFYSVGRLYNQSPKVIAAFNNLPMEKGLSIGQHIKIPLNAQNYDVAQKANAGEILVPLKHVVAKGESIFKVATAYNITALSIREWNLLSSDNVSQGTALVIGHLKVKSGESFLANGKSVNVQPIAAKPVATNAPKAVVPAPVKDEPVVVAATTPPAAKKNEGTFSAIDTKKTDNSAIVNEPVKKDEPAVNNENVAGKDIPSKSAVVIEPMSRPQQPVQQKTERKNIDISTTAASTAEGAFASIFSNNLSHKSLNTKSGQAATFKSTSGWQDRKYYVLMNDIAPGTIVKLQSGDSKVVYAKVLGSVPEMKENNGLLLRISNAAASYLGIVDPRFPVQISYYQ